MSQVTTLKIAGPAGMGIKSGGQLISRILMAHGFQVHDYSEYPSLVRGGHNTYQVSFSIEPVFSPHYFIDLFFSISPNHWQIHQPEFTQKTLVFADEDSDLRLPLKDITTQIGTAIVTNTVCLGAAGYLLGLDQDICRSVITSNFGDNAEINLQAFEAGYTYALKNFSSHQKKLDFPPHKNKDSSLIDGNEAFGWGFVQGGGNFYAAYPMTPATGALHFLAAKQKDFGISVIHPEDEIAVASIATGAAFAGARTAVGTSGGGFALMNETISFNGISEIGVVYYLVSRPGPATGLPTWTSHGDLLHALYSGHGEFPKIVLAPSSQLETLEFSKLSLDLAQQFQVPLILLSDKFIAESGTSLPQPIIPKNKPKNHYLTTVPDSFKRYQVTSSGVSESTIPGVENGMFLANSYEHDETGYSTEDAQIAKMQMDKRARKLKTILKHTPKPAFLGSPQAKKLVIAWGSTTGPVLEALKNKQDKYALLILKTLWPINPELQILLKPYQDITVIENNQTSQLVTLLKSQFDFNPTQVMTKYDGRPFYPEEIIKLLKL